MHTYIINGYGFYKQTKQRAQPFTMNALNVLIFFVIFVIEPSSSSFHVTETNLVSKEFDLIFHGSSKSPQNLNSTFFLDLKNISVSVDKHKKSYVCIMID